MKEGVVPTENLRGFAGVAEALTAKSERLDRMGLIFGKWGLGKTTAVEWFYANHPCFYVRSMAAWQRSANMMIEDILAAYHVEARGRLKQDVRELVRTVKKHGVPLFIDEADRVVRRSLLIETVRDVHDLSRVPIILIAQEDALNILGRHDLAHVLSRITARFEFKELSVRDIQRAAQDLCELTASEKVGSFIRTVCLGDFRLLNAFLLRAEELCAFNKTKEITMAIAKEAASAVIGPAERPRKSEAVRPESQKAALAAAG